MPPKAPPPSAATATQSKGKGKEDNAATTTSSSSSATGNTNATSSGTSTPAAVAATAPQRRQPIGKVIHYFADSQSQGYDGAAFQEAYRGVLQKLQETQEASAAAAQKGGDDEEAEKAIAELKEEDLQTFITLTGLSSTEARDYFRRVRSVKLEDAAKLYLQPTIM